MPALPNYSRVRLIATFRLIMVLSDQICLRIGNMTNCLACAIFDQRVRSVPRMAFLHNFFEVVIAET